MHDLRAEGAGLGQGGHAPDAHELVARSIREARVRARCEIVGRVVTVAAAPGRLEALDVVVDDGSGTLLCHFQGRRSIPGVLGGTWLRVDGTLVIYRARACLLNPSYEFVDADSAGTPVSS